MYVCVFCMCVCVLCVCVCCVCVCCVCVRERETEKGSKLFAIAQRETKNEFEKKLGLRPD